MAGQDLGVLVIAIGAAIGLAAGRDEINASIATLALASAISLLLVDVIYVVKRVIPRIYLLDAVAELALIAAWTWMFATVLS